MRLEVQFLPARQGDAIWVRWPGHQLLIDLGTEQTGSAFRERLSALPGDRRGFDLLVITHVDSDHIGGVLSCFADAEEELPGLSFGDVWFNGWEHLHGQQLPPHRGAQALEGMGPAQGERLASWLRKQPWNEAFDRFPVACTEGAPPTVVPLPGGLVLTVLGPTASRLADLRQTWKDEVEIALAKGSLSEVSPGLGAKGGGILEAYGSSRPPVLEDRVDLQLLAESPSRKDTSKTNATSITLLAEWEGRRILLTGDAFAEDLTETLTRLGGREPVRLDLFKLPHHGSQQNLTRELVEAVRCPSWLFSTDGTTFRHPDAPAIARLLNWGRQPRPTLGFNVPSPYNRWWDNDTWRGLFGYDVKYGDDTNGLTIRFDPAPPG
jgi:hypothetical protein